MDAVIKDFPGSHSDTKGNKEYFIVMSTQSENTKRIARNTLMLYVRMLFGMLVSFYTSRVILSALGVEDYGIYGVVGGLVSMLSLVSLSLSGSISRFMTFELGRGDMVRLRQVFSTSLLIQIAIGVVVLLIGETVGLWFLNTQMVIPAARLTAANWIYQAAIFNFLQGLISCPFHASIMAHEKMDVYAYLGIADVVLKLVITLFIAYAPFCFDKLIVYAMLLMCIGIGYQSISWAYCWKHFPESHAKLRFHRQYWKDMAGFAGWNTIGCTAGILKDQGVNVLLNLFFGPVVNAARSIAGTVSGAIGGFAGNFMLALNPQIVKGYAVDDKTYTFYLVERGTRFSFYILITLMLPVLLETPVILDMWLGKYPYLTVPFVRLTLIVSLVDILSSTLITLQNATGRIRNYQIAVGGMLLMNFPLSYLALKNGMPATTVYAVAILVGIACLVLRLLFLRSMAGLSVSSYVRNVIFNVSGVTAAAMILPLGVSYVLPEHDIVAAIVVMALSFVSSMLSVLFLGCSPGERNFIISKAKEMKSRVARLKA